jgi:glycosyltransferase involved in cell wall biosynthesis
MQFFQPLYVERPSGGDTNVQEKIPKVTMSMPVYNGERLIRRALDSILAQTLDDFVLIISDNASNDGACEICLEYARRDPRIRYIRQPVNNGVSFNFWFVFDQAATEHFMWAASDDVRSPDFREVHLRLLESNPDYVGSTCLVKSAGGYFDEVKMGDQSPTGTWFDSMVLFFEAWHANGRLIPSLPTRPPQFTTGIWERR